MRILISFLMICCFGRVSAQTYEVVEVEISCTPKTIEGLNSEGSEFCPFVSGQTLYFTSNREYDLFNIGENNWKNSGYLNIFKAPLKSDIGTDMKFKNPEIVSYSLKIDNHTGPLCFTDSGDTMFFTQVRPVSKENRKRSSKYKPQLFMSIKKGNDWGDPIAMPFNNDAYSFGHPSYDAQNRRLYFASDQEGGSGQKDIYYSELSGDKWSEPVELKAINSEHNEVFPAIIEGYLFFASDMPGGKGGLDLYWKKLGSEDEIKAVQDINSEADDFGMYIEKGMTRGLYSTNKSGNDDIAYFDMEKKVTIKNVLAGRFTYRNLSGEAKGLDVIIVGEEDELILETTTDEEGKFKFNSIDYEGDFTIRSKTEDDLYLTIYDKDGNPVTDLVSDGEGGFSYKKIGYDKGGTLTLVPENMVDMALNQGHLSGQFIYEKFPGKYPNELKVLLADDEGNMKFETFTDQNGNFDFRKLDMEENYILKVPENKEKLILLIYDKKGNVVAQLKSDDRGAFTYRKLKPTYSNSLKVIEEDEDMFVLESKTVSGYFEYKNIATQLEKGLKVQAYDEDGFLLEETMTDKGGKFRFRDLPVGDNVLFKLDESDERLDMEDFTLYIYDRNGKKIAQLRRGQNDFFIFKPLGFDTESTLSQKEEDSLDINLSLKTDYELVVVYFNTNESKVKSSDQKKLADLLKLLKEHPEIEVEVNAYADARSSDEYNLVLSEKRGNWVVDYFLKQGIPKDRFIVNAYGETQLVDEEAHDLNRRAEIRIY
ncbi:MAG: OmpA family protein [Crocinitomicaceae bacterium]